MDMTEEQHAWPSGCQDRQSMMNIVIKIASDSLQHQSSVVGLKYSLAHTLYVKFSLATIEGGASF